MNPINDYLGPIFEQAFAPLIDDGYVRFVYGGGDVGAYLCQHPAVDTIHITGSAHTHDVIVYGAGEEGAARKARDEPRARQADHLASSAGVSPTIVVPGPWSRADFDFQAEHLATQKLHNSGHNCIASQVLVLPESWAAARRLLDAVRAAAARADAAPGVLPGRRPAAPRRARRIPEGRGESASAVRADRRASTRRARTPTRSHEEFFGPVLATTSLPAPTPREFLRNAVRFANER